MRLRLPLCTIVAVATAVAAPVHAQRLATGSMVPCVAPMSWTVTRIDSRFDLSEEEALQAAREAGALWEQAVGRELFRFDAGDGSAISFDFDQRQAEVEERTERERALEAEQTSIDAHRLELERAMREQERRGREYELEAAEYERALRTYNNDMVRLSRQTEVSASERREIERQADELERSARHLQSSVRELNERTDSLRRESDRLNEWISAYNGRQTSHVGALPDSPTEAGRYDETVYWQDAGIDSVTRRIRIFQFSDRDELVLTLAHELGHALGLGHASGTAAVMSEMLESDARAIVSGGLSDVDVRMLSARCPSLGEARGGAGEAH